MLTAAPPASGVEYHEAFAQETGLDDGCADIVTCSQSLHWMEPEPTFAEAARILRPGGLFAAYDYDWPPIVDPELDAAYVEYQRRRARLRQAHGIQRGGDRWQKHEHLERMRASGRFRFCRELLLHSVEDGDADRVVGFARSLGLPVVDCRRRTLERRARVRRAEEVARRVLGDRRCRSSSAIASASASADHNPPVGNRLCRPGVAHRHRSSAPLNSAKLARSAIAKAECCRACAAGAARAS